MSGITIFNPSLPSLNNATPSASCAKSGRTQMFQGVCFLVSTHKQDFPQSSRSVVFLFLLNELRWARTTSEQNAPFTLGKSEQFRKSALKDNRHYQRRQSHVRRGLKYYDIDHELFLHLNKQPVVCFFGPWFGFSWPTQSTWYVIG